VPGDAPQPVLALTKDELRAFGTGLNALVLAAHAALAAGAPVTITADGMDGPPGADALAVTPEDAPGILDAWAAWARMWAARQESVNREMELARDALAEHRVPPGPRSASQARRYAATAGDPDAAMARWPAAADGSGPPPPEG
jgi:hypothetical protein